MTELLSLHGLWRRNWRPISFTYVLNAAENLFDLLYSAAIGYAIDGLLAGNPWRMLPLFIIWGTHLVVGLGRHMYDTRVFTRIYGELATDMIDRQRAANVDQSQIVGRVGLSRELIDFFEVELPAVARSIFQLVGAIVLLGLYDVWLGVFALLALIPISAASAAFGRRASRLNAALNDRIEREADIVIMAPVALVRRHFERLRFWRVRISDSQARSWGLIELAVIGLTVAVLLRLAGLPDVTAGTIYAALAYVLQFQLSAGDIPIIVENVARARDIAKRVAEQ